MIEQGDERFTRQLPTFFYSAAEKIDTGPQAFAVGPARSLEEEAGLEIAVEGVGCGRRVGGGLQESAFDQVG
ncbi:hypothetical protein, partial [Nitrobacter vulgaris]|uniref:hypothetical protein n=1 Tax=Nitrobacter vulgaris TaxID=29421 RepID=UPI001AECD409